MKPINNSRSSKALHKSVLKKPLVPKLSKLSSVLKEKRQNSGNYEEPRMEENKRLNDMIKQFEVELTAKNLNALQNMLEGKKKNNETLKTEVKNIENQIRQIEGQISSKHKSFSLSTNQLRKSNEINKNIDIDTIETKDHISRLNKQIEAKSKNLKEYQQKLDLLKNDFDKLPVEIKKTLVQEFNGDPMFKKYLKTDPLLRSFFNGSVDSLEY